MFGKGLSRAFSPNATVFRFSFYQNVFRKSSGALKKLPLRGSWQGVALTEEGRNGRERLEKNLPPLKGEVARRAGGVRRPSPAEGESPGFLRIRAAFPLPAEAFQGKAGTPQSRLRRASSPCRGALERAYFRQLTPATPLIHRCGGPPSPWGKVGKKLPLRAVRRAAN